MATDVILIGLARCIAMVVVWNDLADGNREYAGLIALNSIFQVLLYSVCLCFLLRFFLPTLVIPVLMSISVLENRRKRWYLFRIPFALGIISRYALIHLKGEDWFQNKYVPFISPITLIVSLLFTIVIMFCLKGELIVQIPMDVVRIAIPLVIYFDQCFVHCVGGFSV
jgi:ACR3 family arsenite transporter